MKTQNTPKNFCERLLTICLAHQEKFFIAFGLTLIFLGLTEVSQAQLSGSRLPVGGTTYDDGHLRTAVGQLLCLMEGSFGALLMIAAGIGAVIAAVSGAYKLAIGLFVVGIGAFILRSLVSVFFGTGYTGVEGCYNDTRVKLAVSELFCFIEGHFGALLMTISGIMAVGAAAAGAYRAAYGLFIVAMGAFILRSLVSLFYGDLELQNLEGGGKACIVSEDDDGDYIPPDCPSCFPESVCEGNPTLVGCEWYSDSRRGGAS